MIRILCLNTKDDAARIYGNTLHCPDFEFIFDIAHSFIPEDFLNKHSPDILLLSLEWIPFYRLVSAEARKKSIPVIYVMDGIIEWTYIWNNHSYIFDDGTFMQPLVADHLCTIGRNPSRYLSSLGLADKINVIGLPRLDNYEFSRKRTSQPTILICTANTYSHNLSHNLYVLQALRDLKSFFDRNKSFIPIWRIPKTLAGQLDIASYVEGETFKESLSRSNALISFPSTCLIEGMLADIPTCLIEYRIEPLLFNSAWQIRSKDHIESVIHELLFPPLQKLAYQRLCIQDELEEGSASEKLIKLIKDIANGEHNHEALQKQQNGPIDYKSIHSQLSAFSIDSQSLLQYELEAYSKHLKKLKLDLADSIKTIYSSPFIRLLLTLKNIPGFKKVNRAILKLVGAIGVNVHR
ncbi:hypothetical protein EUZ85_09275 [Hahella sp. KA22]|uniref:hypothetical protein n=1 Tax=Hahella sp. KA22 TaxID=1628392 RepID=UPI000FDF025B|nr:hypothetical protein [Hahella sp. KA22]AZZ90901.1 hypothetical protein ENC22_06720 [Hahella sp. KA22]QAY54271.1 hypothetical protein EUZ85_09275 [Hahella sp. KA22]